jgi:hypothetical protein
MHRLIEVLHPVRQCRCCILANKVLVTRKHKHRRRAAPLDHPEVSTEHREKNVHRHHQFRLLPRRAPYYAMSGVTTAAIDPAAPATPLPRNQHRFGACHRRDQEACSFARQLTWRLRRNRARRARRHQPCP